MVVALLALTGIFVALYLTLYKVGVIGELTCSIGSCESVNTSKWAMFGGLPVAAWGLGFYIATFALALLGVQDRWADSRTISVALAALSGWGVLFSGWLTYLELFVIHAICMWCVVSAILVAAIFLTALLDLRENVGGGEVAIDSAPTSTSSGSSARITRA
jgi:uncharacterized membrane protein